MGKVGATLTKKIGPLPLVAWVAIGAAIVLVLRLRSGGGIGAIGNPFGQGSGGDGGGGAGAEPTPTFPAVLGPSVGGVLETGAGPFFQTSNVIAAGPSNVIPTTDTASLTEAPIAAPLAYAPPSINPPSVYLSGGSIYNSPATSPLFQAPFVSPMVSNIETAGGGVPFSEGFASGTPFQIVGGVPIGLSEAAIARGGIPGIDVPVAAAPPPPTQ